MSFELHPPDWALSGLYGWWVWAGTRFRLYCFIWLTLGSTWNIVFILRSSGAIAAVRWVSPTSLTELPPTREKCQLGVGLAYWVLSQSGEWRALEMVRVTGASRTREARTSVCRASTRLIDKKRGEIDVGGVSFYTRMLSRRLRYKSVDCGTIPHIFGVMSTLKTGYVCTIFRHTIRCTKG